MTTPLGAQCPKKSGVGRRSGRTPGSSVSEGQPVSHTSEAWQLNLSVLVDDLAAAVTELRSRGVAIGDPVPVGASLQAFVQDPDGNKIELHQASR